MKYKNDKENPIDNFFAQKLGKLEGNPSENAWQALEKGLSQKSRKKNKAIIWLPYAAAATIALIIMSVWLLRQQTTGISNTGLANTGEVESKKNPEKPATIQDVPHTEDTITELPGNKNNEGQLALQKKISKKEISPKENIRKEGMVTQEVDKAKIEKKSVSHPIMEEANKEKIIQPAITPLETTIAQMEKQPTVITPSAFTTEESTTIVVTVNLDEETENVGEQVPEEGAEPVQKKTKAGKIFSTLKKIKKGDFDELGIRPETIVAYVKDRTSANNQSNEK